MAYYGIPSAGLALTASDSNDKVTLEGLGGTLVTSQSVYGAEGNDVISLGALGITATASALVTVPDLLFSGTAGSSEQTSFLEKLFFVAGTTYTDLYTFSGNGTGGSISVSAIGVRTSDQGTHSQRCSVPSQRR